MICTAAATHPKSYSTTGRGSYTPYTSATCVCLPTRPSSVPKLPLSAGSGMLAPFLPVPTVLTPSPCTPSRTDGAVWDPGIGATLYVTRGDKLCVSGFFSAKLRGSQTTWLPCEVKALSIAAATKHFSPYLIQSVKKACILTDSKPCVQAYEKLCRGEFSASPRVSTFLSVVSRYQASVRHISGAAILPSDFTSRNAAACENETCQVCSFISRTRDSVVRAVSVQDVLRAWVAVQSGCPDLHRTHAHLVQGTRTSKKLTNIKDVKRYLQVASVADDGLLVVRRHESLSPSRECIIVPRQALDGLLTALHIQLSHPSCHQLKMVVKRYIYALDLDKAVSRVSDECHSCAAIRSSPTARIDQSTSPPPDAIGRPFAVLASSSLSSARL